MTPKQRDVLRFVEDYWHENDCAPSLQEIATELGYNSRSSVHRIMESLKTRGFINKIKYSARSCVSTRKNED
jgi:repressor LexA